jgi:type I restriction enzyme, S subunit
MSAVPELRFPEFDEEWSKRRLSHYLSVKGKRNRRGAYTKADVLSVSGNHGIVNQVEHLGRSYAGVSVLNYQVVELGDVVYTKSPLKSNPFGIIKANKNRSGIVSTLYAVYEVSDEADPEFVDLYFELDDRTNRYLRPLVQKGAKNDMKINNEKVLIDPVRFPALPEQRKIVSFLGAVDDKIDALRRKLDAFNQFKAGLMQKLFSQELRFKRDDGSDYPDWEQKRLGAIATIKKGKGVSKGDIDPMGTTPCIRYGEIYTAYREVISNVRSSTNVPVDQLLLSNGGEVIIPASGEDPLDMARACCVIPVGVALGGDINIISGIKNGVFLAYYLNNAKRREIARLAQGVSVSHLYGSHLAGLMIATPDLEEQAKIANCLHAIDAKVGAVETEVAQMQAFKAGLLQKMFV